MKNEVPEMVSCCMLATSKCGRWLLRTAILAVVTVFSTTSALAAAGDPLCFIAEADNSMVALYPAQLTVAPAFQYKLGDDGEWQTYEETDISLDKDEKVYFRAATDVQQAISVHQEGFTMFYIGGRVAASGDVTTLLKKTGTDTVGPFGFGNLFDCCDGLTAAPELPATNLNQSCYMYMFSGCTRLTEAPVLPATTLAEGCYLGMFAYCYNLEEVTLYAGAAAEGSFNMWLEDCADSGVIKCPASLVLEADSVNGVPYGWTRRILCDHVGHIVNDSAVAATCRGTGLSAGSHCSRCGEVIVAQAQTRPAGHTFVGSTCTACGTTKPTISVSQGSLTSGWTEGRWNEVQFDISGDVYDDYYLEGAMSYELTRGSGNSFNAILGSSTIWDARIGGEAEYNLPFSFPVNGQNVNKVSVNGYEVAIPLNGGNVLYIDSGLFLNGYINELEVYYQADQNGASFRFFESGTNYAQSEQDADISFMVTLKPNGQIVLSYGDCHNVTHNGAYISARAMVAYGNLSAGESVSSTVPDIVFTPISGLPEGVEFGMIHKGKGSDTYTIFGTPANHGSYQYILYLGSLTQTPIQYSYTMTVGANSNPRPTLVSRTPAEAEVEVDVGDSVQFQVTANANGDGTLVYNWYRSTWGNLMPIDASGNSCTYYPDSDDMRDQLSIVCEVSSDNWEPAFRVEWPLRVQVPENGYSVVYEPNGAEGKTNPTHHEFDVGKALSMNGFTRECVVEYDAAGGEVTPSSASSTSVFNGWANYEDSSTYAEGQVVTNITSSPGVVYLYAKWIDGTVTLPTPTRTGYVFRGWYYDAEYSSKAGMGGDAFKPSFYYGYNEKLYARWKSQEEIDRMPFLCEDADWEDETDGSWRSAPIGNNESTTITKTIDVPGTLTFKWKVSSESYYDCLKFLVDGEQKQQISGVGGGWQEIVWEVADPEGPVTFSWTYSKDSSSYSGEDCGWIKDLVFTPDTRSYYNIAYDGNGANEGNMSSSSNDFGVAKALSKNAYAWNCTVNYDANGGTLGTLSGVAQSSFLGWATNSTGTVLYADEQVVTDLRTVPGTVRLYAVWNRGKLTLPTPTWAGHEFMGWYTASFGGVKVGGGGEEYCPEDSCTLYAVWRTPGIATPFVCDDEEWTADADDSWRSAPIGDSENTSVHMTVHGPGTLTFKWRSSSQNYCDCMYFYKNDDQWFWIYGISSDWVEKTCTTEADGDTTFTWQYVKDGSVASGKDCGWIKDIVWTPDARSYYTIYYDGNGYTDGWMNSSSNDLGVATALASNRYTRTYCVSFNGNGGSCEEYVYAKSTFQGWARTYDGEVEFADQEMVTNVRSTPGDVTLYAKWQLGSITLQTPVKNGYEFLGWYSEFVGGERIGGGGDSFVPSGNVSLYARWRSAGYSAPFICSDEEWPAETDGSWRTAQVGYYQSTIAYTNISGTGYLTFKWKTSCADNSSLSFYDAGSNVGSIYGDTDWTNVFYYIQSSGSRTIYWAYQNYGDVKGQDCGWVKDIVWTPEGDDTYTVIYNGAGATSGSMSPSHHKIGVSSSLNLNGFTNSYEVSFDANGGEVSASSVKVSSQFLGWSTYMYASYVSYTDGAVVSDLCYSPGCYTLYAVWGNSVPVTLPTPTRDGYVCTGWFTAATGGELIGAAGESCTITVSGTLYAHWRDSSIVMPFVCDDAAWTYEDDGSWRSAPISDNGHTEVHLTVTGPGTLTFKWKVSSENNYDMLYFYRDSSSVDNISGTYITDFVAVTNIVEDSGSVTFRWRYEKDYSTFSGQDCGWIKDVVWTPDGEPVVPSEPIPDIGQNPSAQEVQTALAGSADDSLLANITDGETYNAYRTWANSVKNTSGTAAAGQQAVKDSPNAWLSFALATDKLIASAPVDGDLEIDKFEPTADGKYKFVLSLNDIEVGAAADADNLKKVFGLEGANSITGPYSSSSVSIVFGTPENGKVTFTATPADPDTYPFYMKANLTK